MPYKKIIKAAAVLLGLGIILTVVGTLLMGGDWSPFMEETDAWYRVIQLHR